MHTAEIVCALHRIHLTRSRLALCKSLQVPESRTRAGASQSSELAAESADRATCGTACRSLVRSTDALGCMRLTVPGARSPAGAAFGPRATRPQRPQAQRRRHCSAQARRLPSAAAAPPAREAEPSSLREAYTGGLQVQLLRRPALTVQLTRKTRRRAGGGCRRGAARL